MREPLPGRLGQPPLHLPRQLPSGHRPSGSRDGRALRRLPGTGVDAVFSAAYGVGEAGTSDRHVEA
jgi:hypothetical protein